MLCAIGSSRLSASVISRALARPRSQSTRMIFNCTLPMRTCDMLLLTCGTRGGLDVLITSIDLPW